MARHLAATGSEGLVVAGTTGEGPVLTDAERIDLFRAVVGAVDIPVIASTGTNDTAHSVQMTKEAKAVGVDGILAVTPYYNRPSPAGLSAHFRAIAEATDLPVLLYDIPVRSGRRIGTRLTLELAREVRTIVGVKDATGDVAAAATVVAEAPDGFDVYCGDDSLTLPFASVGGAGVDQRGRPLGRPSVRRDDRRHRAGDVQRAVRSTSTWPSPTGSSPPTSSPTRCRPKRPAGPWAWPSASAGCPTPRPRRRWTNGPGPSSRD